MLGLDCLVPHIAGLVLRTLDRLARVFCEGLEHTPRIPRALPTLPNPAVPALPG